MSRDWFETLFGFEEKNKSYTEVQSSFEISEGRLHSRVNNREFAIGQFSLRTLEELRTEGKKLLLLHKQKSPTNQAVHLSHITTPDILEEHGKPENRHALFQVASQFNCLEFVSPSRTPEHGITCYDLDNTQGPACAIAAGAATVFRNYFAPVPFLSKSLATSESSSDIQPNEQFQIGQTKALQIDTLDCLAAKLRNHEQKFWVMRNGYINSSTSKLERLNPYLDPNHHDIDHLRKLIKVGFHQNVQVTSIDDSKQIVSQVLCSAVGISYTLVRASEWRLFALLILEAAYEATLWTGVINYFASKRITPTFLTFVGGGAFGNPPEWIAYSLARAVAVLENEGAGSILDCRLVHFRTVDQKMQDMIEQEIEKQRETS